MESWLKHMEYPADTQDPVLTSTLIIKLTSVAILFASHSKMTAQALVIIKQISVVLATPCQLADAL